MRDYTKSILKTPQDIEAMIAFSVIKDLGKNKEIINEVENFSGEKAKDHDEVLKLGLKYFPEKFQSFDRLPNEYKSDKSNALEADFNLVQFVQGECLAGNLKKIKNIQPKSRDIYLLQSLLNVAGAAGHINPNGSIVMTNPVYKNYILGIESVNELWHDSEKEVYDNFLRKKANDLDLPFESYEDYALVRLALMSRANNPQEAQEVLKACDNMDEKSRLYLEFGLCADGIGKSGLLLYYSPAFIQNAINSDPENKIEMLTKAYEVMSRIYYYNPSHSSENKIKTISLLNIANLIKENPEMSPEELYNNL